MKKELVAALALLLLCLAVAFNIYFIKNTTNELCTLVKNSEISFASGDINSAEAELRDALEIWSNFGNYTYVALRHTEIDTVTDSFYELLSEIIDESDQAYGNYEHVLIGLNRISKMETPSLGSVF